MRRRPNLTRRAYLPRREGVIDWQTAARRFFEREVTRQHFRRRHRNYAHVDRPLVIDRVVREPERFIAPIVKLRNHHRPVRHQVEGLVRPRYLWPLYLFEEASMHPLTVQVAFFEGGVQLVRPRLINHLHRPTGGMAIFGRNPGTQDLHLFHRVGAALIHPVDLVHGSGHRRFGADPVH